MHVHWSEWTAGCRRERRHQSVTAVSLFFRAALHDCRPVLFTESSDTVLACESKVIGAARILRSLGCGVDVRVRATATIPVTPAKKLGTALKRSPAYNHLQLQHTLDLHHRPSQNRPDSRDTACTHCVHHGDTLQPIPQSPAGLRLTSGRVTDSPLVDILTSARRTTPSPGIAQTTTAS